jgi:hypothetical protein
MLLNLEVVREREAQVRRDFQAGNGRVDGAGYEREPGRLGRVVAATVRAVATMAARLREVGRAVQVGEQSGLGRLPPK